QQLLPPDERRDVDVGPPDLDRAVRIAADTAGEVMHAREFEGPHVARRCDLAGVEYLHNVEHRRDALEDRPAKVPAPVPAEGMREIRDDDLLVDHVDGEMGGTITRED